MRLHDAAGCLLGLAMMVPLCVTADVGEPLPGDPYGHETKPQRDARMAWWREAKFGMFVHWGVYAVPAGTYDGKEIGGIGEWIMRNAKIPSDEYRSYAKDFTAEHYDPKAWAALAKEAGMRYMIITSKHHDGFALFPSEVSDWNAVDAGASKRDLIAPLAEAARAEGLKFGLYYSQSQDWMHPGGAIYGYKEGEVINQDHKGSYDAYLKNIAIPQTREILTRYQPDVLWWDTPRYMTEERARSLAELLKLRPGIIHNNRLGGGYVGDTETPEQYIPATGYPGRDWETCMTMNDTWGFKSFDHKWKSATTLITQLIDAASKGGNYLLNVGPDATGRIPAESVNLLKQVGQWMRLNGESIYGTEASPFACRMPWGRCTSKASGGDTTLYLHVLEWPETRELLLPGLTNPVKSAQVLVGGAALEVVRSPHGPVIKLAAAPNAEHSTTLKLVIAGQPSVKSVPVTADADGVIRLTPLDARLKGVLRLGQRAGSDIVTGWGNAEDTVSWHFEAPKNGNFMVKLHTAEDKGGAVIMVKGIGKFACPILQTENRRTFKANQVGEVALKQGQRITLSLHPVADGWQSVNLKMVELVPLP